MKSTLARIGYLPTCPHCKHLIHDLLYHYRTEDDVYFYFHPLRAAPSYDEFKTYALSYIHLASLQQSRTHLTSAVPHLYSNGTLVVPKSGVPSNIPPYTYHPATLTPFIRRIKKRGAYDHSITDQKFFKEYEKFVSTIIGQHIKELK